MLKRFAIRHRLEKKDPKAAVSEAVRPIVYYLDPAAPEPVRSALLEGARWWTAAFEKAGFKNAFRVEMLPPGADLLDARYNVIEWVHRSTRGWSYGDSIVDPRTGEIIKGHVLLGSLRVRQDYLLAEGLLAPYAKPGETIPDMAAMALARIRQLAAHEVGHTLGLGHNFLASAEGPNGRASVMDYPQPLTRLRPDGTVDLKDAYAKGVGAWDEIAIRYGYGIFPEGAGEAAALDKVLSDARAKGLTFLTDQDARAPSTAHPQASLWDNGTDAAAELDRMMDARRPSARHARRGARPALSPSSLSNRRHDQVHRRHLLYIRNAWRRPGAVARRSGGRAAARARRRATHAAPVGTGDPAQDPGAHPAAPRRLRPAPRIVRPPDRRGVRSDRARRNRGRADGRHAAAPRARRASRHSARARPQAPRPRRRSRTIDRRRLRRGYSERSL
jgi:hypothetical protein